MSRSHTPRVPHARRQRVFPSLPAPRTAIARTPYRCAFDVPIVARGSLRPFRPPKTWVGVCPCRALQFCRSFCLGRLRRRPKRRRRSPPPVFNLDALAARASGLRAHATCATQQCSLIHRGTPLLAGCTGFGKSRLAARPAAAHRRRTLRSIAATLRLDVLSASKRACRNRCTFDVSDLSMQLTHACAPGKGKGGEEGGRGDGQEAGEGQGGSGSRGEAGQEGQASRGGRAVSAASALADPGERYCNCHL